MTPRPELLDPLATAKSRYRYVRTVIKRVDRAGNFVEIITGVECDERPIVEQYADVLLHVGEALGVKHCYSLDDATLAAIAERVIRARWPDRSYFIEVGRNDREWIQVFAP